MPPKKKTVHFGMEEEEGNESPYDSADDNEEEMDDEEEEVEEGVLTVKNTNEDIVDDLTYDLFNFTACSYHPLVWSSEEDKEQTILTSAARACQLLYKK